MFKLLKLLILIVIVGAVVGYFWLLPKYQYIQKNPGYCVNLSKQLLYCGSEADIKGTLESTAKKISPNLQNQVKNLMNKK